MNPVPRSASSLQVQPSSSAATRDSPVFGDVAPDPAIVAVADPQRDHLRLLGRAGRRRVRRAAARRGRSPGPRSPRPGCRSRSTSRRSPRSRRRRAGPRGHPGTRRHGRRINPCAASFRAGRVPTTGWALSRQRPGRRARRGASARILPDGFLGRASATTTYLWGQPASTPRQCAITLVGGEVTPGLGTTTAVTASTHTGWLIPKTATSATPSRV